MILDKETYKDTYKLIQNKIVIPKYGKNESIVHISLVESIMTITTKHKVIILNIPDLK